MTEACAALVEEGDPGRFAATMAAPVAVRGKLWPLYAANLEIARAPWAASEPMVAEMRLQWWIDTITDLAKGSDRRGHPVTEALSPMLQRDPALASLLNGIAEARRWDCWREPFEDRGAFDMYLDQTSGNLIWAAARALGAPSSCEGAVRAFAWGAGLAAYFRAAPELEARGRVPFTDGRPESLRLLASEGRARIAQAKAANIPLHARPALLPGATADAVLKQAERDPCRIADGRLGVSGIAEKWALLTRALTGRY
ncbi:squalene/phytoene synthase family protein [Defluviimonas aestuarii]|uniref:squalene/phytoene synthase family protein n=1 Tax=Albidovulum aestuarii TaxID=1130726 RepID=UPI00249B2263|nr:squalene/phytoene synthase family protein [Defluviimonas aestuarii]MDI3337442.1 squalene/phytoene synthase family protein [Defluviimonas aestuarii]